MPDNKRQHYAPQYVLKQFACDSDKRQIDLFNIERAKAIRGASLRGQCYRDHFYDDKTEVEKALCELEGSFSSLTRRIVTSQQLEPENAGTITTMIALQRGRTLRSVGEFNAMIDRMMKLMVSGRVDEATLRQIRVNFKKLAPLFVAESVSLSSMLLDLDQFLLVNGTAVPFVLSDNPVVTTNWFCRQRFPHCGLGSIARSGVQLVIPLSPLHALLLHDRYVYSVKHNDNVIAIDCEKDVERLNALQWVNAYKNVYIPLGLPEASRLRLMQIPR